jgi:hypothetical protein
MTYKVQLYPWCIIRPLPNMRTQIIGRFRNRSDAEGHLRILKRLMPNIPYQIMFDIPLENLNPENLTPPTGLPYQGIGEKNSPLLRGEGLGERSTEE